MDEHRKVTIQAIKEAKGRRKLTMLTAYDYPFAALLDESGVDMLLVGDSLANVVLGLESTRDVGMEELLHHAKAVTRAAKRALVVADMPYAACQVNPGTAGTAGRRFIEEAGCAAVKIEWFADCEQAARSLIAAGIPVMGHIGLTPQTADQLGGFRVQGKDAAAAAGLMTQARLLQALGCFALVLECVPDRVAARITGALKIPTIGIGAGPDCDGQVLVTHDILGLFSRHTPKFVKQYADLADGIRRAAASFKHDVEQGRFPALGHTYSITDAEYQKFIEETGRP